MNKTQIIKALLNNISPDELLYRGVDPDAIIEAILSMPDEE